MELTKLNLQSKVIKSLLIIVLGSVALTISAKIKIPFYPVPMTMQTFVVMFLGLSFGYKIGLATVSLYLFEGIIGLPVFSNSPERGIGLVYFTAFSSFGSQIEGLIGKEGILLPLKPKTLLNRLQVFLHLFRVPNELLCLLPFRLTFLLLQQTTPHPNSRRAPTGNLPEDERERAEG